MRSSRLLLCFALASLSACDPAPPEADAGIDANVPSGPTGALVDYESTELYDAPWPDERLRRTDGSVDLSGFPNPQGVAIVTQLVEILEAADGFGVSSTIYFPLSGAVDEGSLPDVRGSLEADASVFLVDVDPDSDERGTRWPIDVSFLAEPGPFGAPNLLAVLPWQGRPLRTERLYAAVVTTGVQHDGAAVEVAPATAQLLAGERPAGLSDGAFADHQSAIDALRESGVDLARVASTAVFRTWDPSAELRAARAQLVAGPAPAPEGALTAAEVFDDYCVFHGTLRMPDFQGGVAPYATEGGGWVRDGSGALVEQRAAEANLWVTLPRGAMPDTGFPAMVFVRTGGGGDRPLVDRGPRSASGETLEAGTGPAMHFARAGFAGVSVDGPLGGLRNLEDWDEQFAVFNINNPAGLRDNVRQSALELMHLTRLFETLTVDASTCPGLSTSGGDGIVRLDTDQLGIMGHSMGATIAPLAVALEPAYRAMVLSGAGGSWIRNVIHKESPIAVRPAAEAMLRYTDQGRTLVEHDPALALLQWSGEPAEPLVYARSIVTEPDVGTSPRHVLMFQGILDTYIPPPVANPLSLALGLDLGGEELDRTLPERYPALGDEIDFGGGGVRGLPVSGNRAGGTVTAAVVQHPEDGIEDGHEVMFQTTNPQHQYRCFLSTMLAEGVPRIIATGATTCE